MIYAAWFDIHNDDEIVDHPTALRVYARLLRNPLIFMQPQDVKAWTLAEEMRVNPKSVQLALSLLIDRGYAIDHGRSFHNVRRLTLTMERTPQSPDISGASKRIVPAPPGPAHAVSSG
jgi:hypothetical protein